MEERRVDLDVGPASPSPLKHRELKGQRTPSDGQCSSGAGPGGLFLPFLQALPSAALALDLLTMPMTAPVIAGGDANPTRRLNVPD